MVFLHLFIVNKSGGLIHHRALSDKAPQIGTNDWLRIGSTFHSLHAIATEASPIRLPGNKNSTGADDGIEEIQAMGMILRSFQTRTGLKFVLTYVPTVIVWCLVDVDVAFVVVRAANPHGKFYRLNDCVSTPGIQCRTVYTRRLGCGLERNLHSVYRLCTQRSLL
jgi:Sybindin-like family